MRSKAYWGYDLDFLEQCREILRLDENLVAAGLSQVALVDDRLGGVVEISVEHHRAELELIFVHPDWMKRGIGNRLYDWAAHEARTRRCTEMHILSDPNARGFYESKGARFQLMAASDAIAGRMLPRLVHHLA